MSAVVIYNMGGQEIVGRVSVRHAIKMVHRKVARVHTAREGERLGEYEIPEAVELLQYVFAKWLYATTGQTFYSKKGVLRRDNYTCAYCGRSANTVDHVLPRKLGGESTWENSVAACFDCNQKKGHKTLKQAKMALQWTPFTPTFKQAYA